MTPLANSSLEDWYLDELLPDFDWEGYLESLNLNPKKNSTGFSCDCPKCGETGRATFFPNKDPGNSYFRNPRFLCNRKGECVYNSHILAHLNGDDTMPSGEDWSDCVKQLANFAGKELPKGSDNYQKAPPQRSLLNEYFEFTQARLQGSKEEKYIKNRGLDPSKHEYGLFPNDISEVNQWAHKNGWKVTDLEEAGLIKKGTNGQHYPFCYGRLAGAFKDSRGNIFNIWGRDLTGKVEDKFKYLNLPNSKHAHKKAPYIVGDPSDNLVFVEGYLDACALAECGFRAAAAGTNTISNDMWEATACKRAILCLDQDPAGKKGALSFLQKHLNEKSPSIWFINPEKMQGCKDFSELYQKHSKEAVDAAMDEDSWIHRDTMLAGLIIDLNSDDKSSLSDVEREELCEKAYELDKLLTTERCPSFGEYFWEPFCEVIGYNLDLVLASVENSHERQRREQARLRLESLSGALTEAFSKGNGEEAKRLQDSINREMQALEQQGDAIRDLTAPYTRDDLKEELSQTAEGVRTGLVIEKEEIIFTKGGLTVIGGPTNHGKTTFLCNVTLNAIAINNSDILFITLEESRGAITSRLAHTFIGTELSKHSLGSLRYWYGKESIEMFSQKFKDQDSCHLSEFKKKEEAFWSLIQSKRLTIVTPEKSLNAVIATITAAIERNPKIGCVVLDYLQLVEPFEKSGGARHEELKPICAGLHTLSKDHGLAIVAGAQFNRTVVSEDHLDAVRLGEGGSIERFADQVIGFWNRTFKQEKDNYKTGDELQVDILKNRNFPRREGVLSWDGNLGKVGHLQTSPPLPIHTNNTPSREINFNE